MSISLYMDHNVPRAITEGVRHRGVKVKTAYENGREAARDPEILDRATDLSCVLFTQDDDFLPLTAKWQRTGISFSGVIYAHPLKVTIGRCIEDLTLIAKIAVPEDLQDHVVYLPL